jgi:hypothetical protein
MGDLRSRSRAGESASTARSPPSPSEAGATATTARPAVEAGTRPAREPAAAARLGSPEPLTGATRGLLLCSARFVLPPLYYN